MKIRYSSKFKNQYAKLSEKLPAQFDSRLALFLIDSSYPQLRVHPLTGKYAGYCSLNVNGDLRALYLGQGDVIIIFNLIDTHNQLYG